MNYTYLTHQYHPDFYWHTGPPVRTPLHKAPATLSQAKVSLPVACSTGYVLCECAQGVCLATPARCYLRTAPVQ